MKDKMSKKEKSQVVESIIAIIITITILSNTGPIMSLFLIVIIFVITLCVVLIGKFLRNKFQKTLAFFIPHSFLVIAIITLTILINQANDLDGWTYLIILGATLIVLILSFPPYFFFEEINTPKEKREAH